MKNKIEIPESLFGAHPEFKTFKRDRNDFHELSSYKKRKIRR